MTLTVESGPTVATYLWHRGTQTNIGGLTPSPQFVESGGMNDLVEIIGSTISPTTNTFCAFSWQHGQMTELASPAGSPAVFGIANNLLGQVAGVAYDANFNGQVALWNHGALTLLPGGIPGGDFAQPVGINIRGEIVGYSNNAANVPSTVLWRQGVPTVLVPNSSPGAINDEGEVVGTIQGPSPRAFLWQNGTTTQLQPIGGAGIDSASGINDLGQIVGWSDNAAVLWQNGGAAINLNSQIAPSDPLQPYVRVQTGRLINNLGDIVATGVDSRNPNIAQWYLLTPVR